MAIKDVKFRNSKPKEKPYKVSDEKGLYLLVNPNGSRLSKLKYRFAGVEKNFHWELTQRYQSQQPERPETKRVDNYQI